MLYKINHGTVRFGDDAILDDIDFEIRDTEKIAVVGRNGCGKTTLLKLIAGEHSLSKRESDANSCIAKAGNPVIGYLRQIAFKDTNLSMEEEIREVFAPIELRKRQLEEAAAELEKDYTEDKVARYTAMQESFSADGGYYYEKEYETLVRKFGFSESDKKKPLCEFSGGQQTKIAFIKLLLSKPDILLLDEPTNHLDISTIQWLEGYLKNYAKAVVVVSHDRMFLDNIADVVYEIEYGRATRYVGNYSDFVVKKRERYEKQKKDYLAQQKEIARLEEIIEKFKNKPTKVAMTRSKLKQIEHMVKIDPPDRYDNETFHAQFQPDTSTGRDVLTVKDLKIGYGEELSQISLTMQRGEKLGVIGGNGLGKSTFLKTIVGEIPSLGGTYQYGTNVKIGYFDQQMAMYRSNKQLLDDFWDEFPELTQTQARSALGAFLFSGEDVFKDVNMLSGGEKVRLALCKIFMRRPNVLILDEPTNHMDLVGKETLEAMLKDYKGTLIFVSHDRYFVKKVADQILSFEDGTVRLYRFGYEEYEEKRQALLQDEEVLGAKAIAKVIPKEEKKTYYNPGKERSKIANKCKKLEQTLAEKEEIVAGLKEKLKDPEVQTSYMKLGSIQEEIDAAEEELLALMEEWEALTERLKELDAE